jgi:hypothetical protein
MISGSLKKKKKEIKSFLEVNENENTTYQNLWEIAKAALIQKFIAMTAYMKRSQINDLMLPLKLLEKQEQANPKTSRRREIIKIKAEMKEIETKKKYKESTKQKAVSLKKTNKIDRPLANLTKVRRENTQISKIRNAKGEITTNIMEIQENFRDYFENLYFNKFENLEEMDRFLGT